MTFEAAGGWLVASRPTGDPGERDELVAAVRVMRDHLPRVSASLYPPQDPGFGPG